MAEQAQPNKPLSGVELKELIMKDLSSVLDGDTMLVHHIAYRSASYSILVKIMTANPIIPDWTNKTRSKRSTPQQIDARPELAAIHNFPLQREATDEAMDFGLERTRQIISPNQSRIENGLGVPITRRTAEGNVVEEKVHYDIDVLPDDGGFPDGMKERSLTKEEIATE